MVRDAQHHFNPSNLFKPWIDRERQRRSTESKFERQKRKPAKKQLNVKIGHGGTLDPMATGVLILGIGSGTKQLNYFTTECTKSYEAVVLFGAATDTYDTEGKVVARQEYSHVTKEIVEAALEKYRGKGMQKPPIYSALWANGKRFYEYAREGKEIPIEIKERPVNVSELEMLEWMDGGSHDYHWPEVEAEAAERQVVQKVLHLDDKSGDVTTSILESSKRKRDTAADEATEGTAESSEKRTKTDSGKATVEADLQSKTDTAAAGKVDSTTPDSKPLDTSEEQPTPKAARPPCSAPACRIRMTVTSGFYVRSLCHDLGHAIGSLGIMAKLVRTRQGPFELGANVLPYEDLKEGEDVWGPKVKAMLATWEKEHPRTD